MLRNKRKWLLLLGVLAIVASIILFFFGTILNQKGKQSNGALFSNPKRFVFILSKDHPEGSAFVFNEKEKNFTRFEFDKRNRNYSSIKFECDAVTMFPGGAFEKAYAPCFDGKKLSLSVFDLKSNKTHLIDLSSNKNDNFNPSVFLIDAKRENALLLAQGFDADNNFKSSVIIIDQKTDSVSQIIDLGTAVIAKTATISGDQLIFYNIDDKEVTFFDLEKKEISKKVAISKISKANRIAVDSKGAFVYLLGGDGLNVVNINSGEVKFIPIKSEALEMTSDEKENKIFITSSSGEDNNGFLTVVDTKEHSVSAENEIGRRPYSLAIDDENIYIGNRASNSISVMRKGENRITATIPSGGTFPVALAINRSDGKMYVANYESNTIGVIDLPKKKLIEVLPNEKSLITPGILFFSGLVAVGISLILRKRSARDIPSISPSEQG